MFSSKESCEHLKALFPLANHFYLRAITKPPETAIYDYQILHQFIQYGLKILNHWLRCQSPQRQTINISLRDNNIVDFKLYEKINKLFLPLHVVAIQVSKHYDLPRIRFTNDKIYIGFPFDKLIKN